MIRPVLTVLTGLLALPALLPAAAMAEEVAYSEEYSRCMEASGGVTMDMIDCMSDEHQRWDARLNAAYKAANAASPERQKALQAAQRAWIKFRDANCEYYYDPDGGSAARIAANSCMLTMTAERATELMRLVP